MRDGLLHDPRALDDLRQEHLAGAEEVTHDSHPIHQRALDHVEWARVFQSGFLGVLDDEFDDAVDERVLEPPLHRSFAPCEVVLLLLSFALDGLCQRDESLGRIGATVEKDVFDVFEEIFGDLLIDLELTGIDDPHVHPGGDRVVEERGMHRFAHAVVAAEREAEVAHASADQRSGATLLDLSRRFDEIDRVLVVLLDPGCHRKDVGVEHDVGRGESGLLDEQPIRACTNIDLALDRLRLPLLVEGHHDRSRAVTTYLASLFEELGLAFLQADRVDDAFALHTLQTRFEDAPLGAVDHDRHTRDLGLGADEIQERGHRLFRVEHALVHVDVDDVRPAAYLLKGYRNRFGVVAFGDQLSKFGGPGDVGALANHDEIGLRPDDERLEPTETGIVCLALRLRARRHVPNRVGDGPDVIRSRATAATDDVDHPVRGETSQQLGHLFWGLIVTTKGIWEACIRVTMHVAIGDPRELLEEGAHLSST